MLHCSCSCITFGQLEDEEQVLEVVDVVEEVTEEREVGVEWWQRGE